MSGGQNSSGYVLAAGTGPAIRFLETLMTVKAGARETGNSFTLLEWTAPAGFAPPPHTHHAEDEAFFILEGSMVVTCGDRSWEATSGSFVFLPRGVPHGFTVTGDTPLRGLQLTVPSGFESFIAEAGEPVGSTAPAAPDFDKVLRAAAKHQIEIHVMSAEGKMP
jgi:mannose-6-phosphate isomerase-like protein (cupin superfamily)